MFRFCTKDVRFCIENRWILQGMGDNSDAPPPPRRGETLGRKLGRKLGMSYRGIPLRDWAVSCQWKNLDFLFNNPDFLLKNPDTIM